MSDPWAQTCAWPSPNPQRNNMTLVHRVLPQLLDSPLTLQATNPVALEWRLLQGFYGASRQTHTLNVNNEYTAKWISHIFVSGEEGGLLRSKDSVAFNSEWKTNPPTNDVKTVFPPHNSEDLCFHYRKAGKDNLQNVSNSRGMWFGTAEANWNESVVIHNCYSDQWEKHQEISRHFKFTLLGNSTNNRQAR